MTNSYGDCYVIKLTCDELTTVSRAEDEVQSLVTRIEMEDPSPPPFAIRPDGIAVSARYRDAVERLIDNPRINREGKRELFLDVGALQAT